MKYSPNRYTYGTKCALDKINAIEEGKDVNKTAVTKESENLAVDHYNLRMRKELIPGKSLAHTLAQWKEVQDWVALVQNQFAHVVFNGIGGSYLGPYMLVQSILGDDYNEVQRQHNRPTLHFLANTDSDSFSRLFQLISAEKTLMVVISKSGSTAETATNAATFATLVSQPNLHMCAITVSGSALSVKAQQFLKQFPMNKETGGRTSICSAVAMVPCAFAGLDFEQFVTGMADMDEATRRPENNPAIMIATIIDQELQVKQKNMIILGYSDSLKHYYHYCQQLYMESLGKEYTHDGRIQPKGLTVFGGIGTGEQHAFMQQIQKGVEDSFVKFVQFQRRTNKDWTDVKAGTMGRQLLAFLNGTQMALKENGRHYISVTVEEPSMYCLGQLIALEERIVTVLAAFWDINAYDQPGVQDAKLAADKVNKISIEIDQKLIKVENATAEEIIKKINVIADKNLAESILNDIIYNPQSYTTKLCGKREWTGSEFRYSFDNQAEIKEKVYEDYATIQ